MPFLALFYLSSTVELEPLVKKALLLGFIVCRVIQKTWCHHNYLWPSTYTGLKI